MKVLITGGSGQVGHALLQACPKNYEPVSPDRRDLDLVDLANLYQQLGKLARAISL